MGILSDKFGRKKLFGSGVLMFTAASLLVGYAAKYWMFLIGRVMLGLATPGIYFTSLIMSECLIHVFVLLIVFMWGLTNIMKRSQTFKLNLFEPNKKKVFAVAQF